MRLNVEFRIELSKTNPGLAKSPFQQKTCGYTQNGPQHSSDMALLWKGMQALSTSWVLLKTDSF